MLYIATIIYVASLHNHAIVASGMHHIVYIKTENIVVDKIGMITCSHLLARAHTYFNMTLLCITYNIVAINSTVQ